MFISLSVTSLPGSSKSGRELEDLLYEGVAAAHLGTGQVPLELLHQIGELSLGQEVLLVEFEDGKGHSEENLRALVEEAVPDPQHGLQRQHLQRRQGYIQRSVNRKEGKNLIFNPEFKVISKIATLHYIEVPALYYIFFFDPNIHRNGPSSKINNTYINI